jgi:hypothetical protein
MIRRLIPSSDKEFPKCALCEYDIKTDCRDFTATNKLDIWTNLLALNRQRSLNYTCFMFFHMFWYAIFTYVILIICRILTYLLHGAGHYLKSWLLLSSLKITRFLTEPEGSSPCSQKPVILTYCILFYALHTSWIRNFLLTTREPIIRGIICYVLFCMYNSVVLHICSKTLPNS